MGARHERAGKTRSMRPMLQRPRAMQTVTGTPRATSPAARRLSPGAGAISWCESPPEATLAPRVGLKRGLQGIAIEVGPEHVGKDQLAVSRLPHQKIADALFARGSNDEIRFAKIAV